MGQSSFMPPFELLIVYSRWQGNVIIKRGIPMTTKNNSLPMIVIALLLMVIAVGGYYIYHEQTTETVSMNIGGEEISATFER